MRYNNPQKNKSKNYTKKARYNKRHYRSLDIPERAKPARKKRKAFALHKVIVIAVFAVALTIALAIILPASAKAQYSTGYEVYLCGKSLGIADDPKAIDAFLADVHSQWSAAYGMDVTDRLELEYKEVAAKAEYICPAEVLNNIIAAEIDMKVVATTIFINDWPAAAVKTPEEAQWVLEQAKAPYETPSTGAVFLDISFVEDVRVEEVPADYYDIVSKEEALHNLTVGPGVELRYHIVVTGDALARIARKEHIKVSDILIANPQISDSSKIYPGDKLLVVSPKNSLSIRYTEVIDRVQEEPFETEYLPDDTKYTTQKKVIQEGKAGTSKVKAEITYINGIEVDYDLLEKEILTVPEKRIVHRGTKSVPKALTLATEHKVPFPLKEGTYKRISEYFGERVSPKEGASTFHKGLDFAADKGTPIYASLDGTVRYAGTGTGYGLYIRLTHDGGVETRYAHCSQLLVKKGDKVKAGQIIALVGSTGVSTGSHLHFEVRIDGVAVNPLK